MIKTGDLVSQRDIRLEKVSKLRKMGFDPYPAVVKKDYKNSEIKEKYKELENKKIYVIGRIMSWREHGKLLFGHISDETGSIQLYIKNSDIEKFDVKKNNLGWENLDLVDVGDFVEAYGIVTQTKTGEISILVNRIRIITKSLRPLPDKWHGIEDQEERFRRRYLDMLMNPEIRERFVRRGKFWNVVRNFLNERDFCEINTPILEPITGGADAEPFVTYCNALDQNFYLRISQELPLKRLLGGGFDKVYDIGARFRNEGLSQEHAPEHMACEFYWAYANADDGMKLIEELFKELAVQLYGKTTLKIKNFDVDFGKKWDVIDFYTVIKEKFGVDIFKDSIEKMNKVLEENGVKLEETNKSRVVDGLWKLIRKNVGGPVFLVGVPKFLSPLAKSELNSEETVIRFQPIIAGSELANCWAELNDPVDQLERFIEQQKMREGGDKEAHMMDIDFVEMLEYGMPPAVGFGITERVFWFFENVSPKEAVPFPMMKYEIDDNTRKIYKDIIKYVENARKFDSVKTKEKIENKKNDLKKQENLNINLEGANKILEEMLDNMNLRKHSYAVAKCMKDYAEKFGENPVKWEVAGLLHDADWQKYPEAHPAEIIKKLESMNVEKDIIHAIKAHGYGLEDEKGYQADRFEEPKTIMAKCLRAVDEISGFVVAVSLMNPDQLSGVKVDSVKKKLKDKAFARNVSRKLIEEGTKDIGIELDEHIENIIKSMIEIKDVLGLK